MRPFSSDLRGRFFADIVEENAEGQFEVRLLDLREHEPDVLVDVAFGMKLGRLLDAVHGGDVGQDFRQQPAFVEQIEAEFRLVAVKILFSSSRMRSALTVRIMERGGANRLPCFRLDLEHEVARQNGSRAAGAGGPPQSGPRDCRWRE